MADNASGNVSVGGVAFDLALNTTGLQNAVNAASQQVNAQLTQAFNTAAQSCSQSLSGISSSVNGLTSSLQANANAAAGSIQNSMNQAAQNVTQNVTQAVGNSTQAVNNNVRNLTRSVSSSTQNAAQNISGSAQTLSSEIQAILNRTDLSQRSQAARIGALYRRQGMNMSDSMTRAWAAVRNSSASTQQSIGQSIAQTARQANEFGGEVLNTAATVGNTLTSAVKNLAKQIISAFAIKEVVRFARSCVEAAASVKALNAQIEQTFNTLQTDAINAINKVAAESGILETRLQGVGTQIYAFAKANGMDSVSALNMMQEALQVTADSAAYYDRSIEDTAESLKSFLKGNFANDAALGISCTETTRNIAANKLYGKSYRDLSEAQKQLTLLQMVKDANELSGAMGQAAREADGWENVTGNLRESWKQFKAAIGQPLLQALIPIIKDITSAIQSLTEQTKQAAAALSELFGWDLSSAENTGGVIVSVANDVADAEDTAQKEIEETAKKSQKSLAGFDKLNVLSQPSSDDDSEDSNTEKTAESAEKAQNAVEKLDNAVKNINLDGVKKQLQKTAEFFKPLVDGVRKNVSASVENAKNGVSGFLESYGDEVQEYSGSISGHLKNTAVQTRNGLAGILEEAALSQERTGKQLSQGYTDFLGGAAVFTLSFANVFADMFDITSGNFEEWVNDNRTLIGEFFDGLNENAANAMSTFGGILEDIGTTLSDWWDNTGAEAFDKLTEAFFDVQTVLLDFWNSYITPFIDYIIDSVGDLWDNHLSALWSGVLDLISSLMEAIAAIWNGFLRPLYDTFIKRIMVGVMGALKSLWDIVSDVIGMIIDVIRGAVRALQGVLDFITGIFTGDAEKAIKGFAEFVQGIAIMIWGVIKGALNLIIDALNTVWSALYGVLKSIVDGVGDFIGMIGDLFGADWGFTMPDEVPRIPRLAHGGLVRAPTIAVVGDNPNAGSDPEVVSPLSKLDTIMGRKDDEALAQILMYLKMLYEVCKEERPIELNAEVDEVQLFRNIVRQNNSYKRTHGGRSAFA